MSDLKTGASLAEYGTLCIPENPLLGFESLDALLRVLREVPDGMVMRVGYLDERGDIVALKGSDLRCRHGSGETRP